MKKLVIAGIVFLACSASAAAAEPVRARAELTDGKGGVAATAVLTQASSGVLIAVSIMNLPPGQHGLHIHAVGKCDHPFTSAAGHFNPHGKKHGFLNPAGPHSGDLPNITVNADGKANVEVFAPGVNLGDGPEGLLDADGSALVVHAGPDDYRSDPAGDSGPRIACGVITK